METVKVYTDGACSGNPGAGAWACVLVYGAHTKEVSGYEPRTTNNRMELTAVIEGLSALKSDSHDVEVISDSVYVVDATNKGWLASWRRNGWRNAQKEAVKNRDLWERLVVLNDAFNPTYTWVKGHANNEFNNRCDQLAVAEIKKHKPAPQAEGAGDETPNPAQS